MAQGNEAQGERKETSFSQPCKTSQKNEDVLYLSRKKLLKVEEWSGE
jgi:hypothetical protein